MGKKTHKKSKATRKAAKDPNGGLTAARPAQIREAGRLTPEPGVKKSAAAMSLAEMRRKGSWAVRFYGRKKMPPLTDKNGEPTRLALSAHAWGEPVPKTLAAAKGIAAKGERLLERYRRLKAKKRNPR